MTTKLKLYLPSGDVHRFSLSTADASSAWSELRAYASSLLRPNPPRSRGDREAGQETALSVRLLQIVESGHGVLISDAERLAMAMQSGRGVLKLRVEVADEADELGGSFEEIPVEMCDLLPKEPGAELNEDQHGVQREEDVQEPPPPKPVPVRVPVAAAPKVDEEVGALVDEEDDDDVLEERVRAPEGSMEEGDTPIVAPVPVRVPWLHPRAQENREAMSQSAMHSAFQTVAQAHAERIASMYEDFHAAMVQSITQKQEAVRARMEEGEEEDALDAMELAAVREQCMHESSELGQLLEKSSQLIANDLEDYLTNLPPPTFLLPISVQVTVLSRPAPVTFGLQLCSVDSMRDVLERALSIAAQAGVPKEVLPPHTSYTLLVERMAPTSAQRQAEEEEEESEAHADRRQRRKNRRQRRRERKVGLGGLGRSFVSMVSSVVDTIGGKRAPMHGKRPPKPKTAPPLVVTDYSMTVAELKLGSGSKFRLAPVRVERPRRREPEPAGELVMPKGGDQARFTLEDDEDKLSSPPSEAEAVEEDVTSVGGSQVMVFRSEEPAVEEEEDALDVDEEEDDDEQVDEVPPRVVSFHCCRDCEVNWICDECASECHQGHTMVPFDIKQAMVHHAHDLDATSPEPDSGVRGCSCAQHMHGAKCALICRQSSFPDAFSRVLELGLDQRRSLLCATIDAHRGNVQTALHELLSS